jgi:hypothetical protein
MFNQAERTCASRNLIDAVKAITAKSGQNNELCGLKWWLGLGGRQCLQVRHLLKELHD